MQNQKNGYRNIEDLAQIVAGLFPELDAQEKRLALTLYRLLAEGKAVSAKRLASALTLSIERVESVLKEWPGVYLNDAQNVVGFWGLALPEMDHRFEVDGKKLYAWCAWDTLFIPQLLGKTAKVQSRCAETGKVIRLRVTPDAVQDLDPAETVLSFITPEAAKVQEDVVNHFCRYVHFFANPDAARQWVSQHPGTFVLSMAEAFRLGQLKNRIRFFDEE